MWHQVGGCLEMWQGLIHTSGSKTDRAKGVPQLCLAHIVWRGSHLLNMAFFNQTYGVPGGFEGPYFKVVSEMLYLLQARILGFMRSEAINERKWTQAFLEIHDMM
jgi:hypothetical protein